MFKKCSLLSILTTVRWYHTDWRGCVRHGGGGPVFVSIRRRGHINNGFRDNNRNRMLHFPGGILRVLRRPQGSRLPPASGKLICDL